MAQKLKFGNGTFATKEGSTLAYNDENNNYKPLPFTTTRDSIATRLNKEGLIEVVGSGVPRIDYTDSEDGVLLLEPQRTNLFTYSEEFSNAAWSKINVTLVSDNGVSPDGTSNADLMYPTATDANFTYTYHPVNNVTVSQYTVSAFVKSSGVNVAWLYIQSVGSVGAVYFDLSDESIQVVNGSSNTLTAEMTAVGNGWYKISCTNVTPIAITSGHGIGISDAKGSGSITKNGTNGVYIWGLQLEQSYATSYIPTSGSTVTRQADTASGAGNSEVFNDSEGVLFANHNYENINPNWSGLGIMDSDGTVDRVIFAVQNNTQNFKVYLQSGGVVRWNPTIVIDVTKYQKVAVKYKSNDNALWINGFEVATDNTVSIMPSGLHKLSYFGYASLEPTYGSTKEIGYYDTALTDAELEYMTSYRSLNELVTVLNLNEL